MIFALIFRITLTVANLFGFYYNFIIMSNDRKAAIKKLRNLCISQKTDISEFRNRIDGTFSSVFLPNSVEYSEQQYGSVICDVLSPELFASNRILLYIHGGSFVGGSRCSYRSFVSALAHATASKAVVPEFRLAPAHPFPASLEDVQSVFSALSTETELSLRFSSGSTANGTNQDKKPEFLIMADTSGASIATALVFSLNDSLRKTIKQVVFFSPWLDFSEDNDLFTTKKASDEVFTAASVRFASENYTYQENWKNPLVSPLKATRDMLASFPPLYIQMGKKELFHSDAVMFQSMLRNGKAKCEIDIWKKMMPLFQLADEFLEESHLAVEKIGRLITEKDHSEESIREIQLVLEKKE